MSVHIRLNELTARPAANEEARRYLTEVAEVRWLQLQILF